MTISSCLSPWSMMTERSSSIITPEDEEGSIRWRGGDGANRVVPTRTSARATGLPARYGLTSFSAVLTPCFAARPRMSTCDGLKGRGRCCGRGDKPCNWPVPSVSTILIDPAANCIGESAIVSVQKSVLVYRASAREPRDISVHINLNQPAPSKRRTINPPRAPPIRVLSHLIVSTQFGTNVERSDERDDERGLSRPVCASSALLLFFTSITFLHPKMKTCRAAVTAKFKPNLSAKIATSKNEMGHDASCGVHACDCAHSCELHMCSC